MKANSAIGFLLVGMALVRNPHKDAVVYGLAVFLLGAVTIFEYVLNRNLGIDQLLLPDPWTAVAPGRMSHLTATGLCLLGAGLVLIQANSPRLRSAGRSAALLVAIISTVALLGYSYDTQALYRVRPYSGMAMHTAAALLLAAYAIQCVTPTEGIMRLLRSSTAGGAMLRQLLPAALAIPFLLGFACWIGHKVWRWEPGFMLAMVVAGTATCLIVIMLRNARRLEASHLELRELNQTLEERVRQRTADLEEQIKERERMQVIVDEQRAHMMGASKLSSLGEMAGGLAHELNSPLNIILGRAADLQDLAEHADNVDSGAVLKATRSIVRTGERIMSVVRGLRVFARDGRTDPFEQTQVQSIVEDTMALCRERFAVNGIQLEVIGMQDDLMIECQRVQISQVMLNLLNNAFDAVQGLPEKWVQIKIEEHERNVVIRVTDSGRGIPKEIAEKALQPFFTTKPVGKGTGLGLSISRGIAEAHRGQLWIDPRGRNTSIVLSLPKKHVVPGRGSDEYSHAAGS